MDWRRNFIVQFEGLKEGLHHYDFKIDDAFFAVFEGELVNRGALDVDLEFEKKSNMLVLNFTISGKVITECDRCGDDLDVPLEFSRRLIVKYGVEGEEPSEDLAFIPHSAYELDVSPYIYEFVVLAMPLRNVHPKGKCNAEALARLEELSSKNDPDIDPRWSKLNELKNDN